MRITLFIAIALAVSGIAKAQSVDGDINILVGVPQGDFRDNLDATAVGINGSLAYPIPQSLLSIGVELGIMTYGEDRRTEYFSPSIPEVRVNVVTDYDIFTGHLFIRYEAPSGGVRPYIDGLLGLNYLFTKTSIKDPNDEYDEIASNTNFDDTAFSYGLGGGLKIKVYDSPKNELYINFKARYLLGSEADYLQPGSIMVEDGILRFDESTSQTNLLTLHLGMSFKF